MVRSTTCSDWLISFLACSSGKLKLVAVLVLVVRTLADVEQCHSCLVFLTGSLSSLYLTMIYSLAPESTRALTSRVLDCLSFFPSGMTCLTKRIGLKCTCFSFLLDLVCLSSLDGFRRLFNRWELSFCSLIFYILLFFNLSMINPSLQPLFQLSYSLSIELLLLSSLLPEYES